MYKKDKTTRKQSEEEKACVNVIYNINNEIWVK